MDEMLVMGIDPSIKETIVSILSVNKNEEMLMKETIKITPPSSFYGNDTDMLSLLATGLYSLLKKYRPSHVCVIEDFHKKDKGKFEHISDAKVIGVIEHISNESAFTLHKITYSGTKYALDLKNNANKITMYNRIVELLKKDQLALSGRYAIGAAVDICLKIIKKWR